MNEGDETLFLGLGGLGTAQPDIAHLTIVDDDIAADVGILKATAGAAVFVSDNVAYTITVTNAGPNSARNVIARDVIPSRTRFVSVSTTRGSCSGTSEVKCSLGTLASGESVTITLVVQMPLQPEIVLNAAVVSHTPGFDPDQSNNYATTTVNVHSPAAVPAASPLNLLVLGVVLSVTAVVALRNSGS